jgi:hypothetical protein
MKGKRFFVLPYSLHGDHVPHLMGRVVLDPFDPLRRFAPDPDRPGGFNPEDIVPNVLREPVTYHSRSEVVRAASGGKLRAGLISYLGLETSDLNSKSVEFQGELVKRYQMINNPLVFRNFMEDARYKKQIEELLLESKGEVLMVVGFLTTKTTRWVASETKECGVGATAQVSAGAIAGLPIDIDPAVDVSLASSTHHGTSSRVEIEEVFAMAYDVIMNKHSFDRSAKGWISSTPDLGNEKRVQAGHLAMGGDDSDEELEYHPEPDTDDAQLDLCPDQEAAPSVEKSEVKTGYLEF